MTQQDDITQRGLTDDEREHLYARYFSHDHPCGRDINALMKDVESTLLSKLRAEGVPYCYALETRGPHGDAGDVLLDIEYNRTDNFSGGRTGGKPLFEHPAPVASAPADERALTAQQRKEFIRRASFISEGDHDTRAAFVDEIARAALASAPVEPRTWHDDYKHDGLMFQRRERASAPVADRQKLRDLVDVVWNEATESTAVPDTPWADRLIDKVFPSLAASAPVARLSAAAQASQNGCRCVRFGKGNPHWPCPLHPSAPVAGEVVAWVTDTAGATDDPKLAETWRKMGWPVRPLVYGDAAPQASEAVRNADVSALLSFIFGRFGQPGDAGELPDTVVAAVRRLERAIQPQADKDGGQQHAGDVDALRFIAGTIYLHLNGPQDATAVMSATRSIKEWFDCRQRAKDTFPEHPLPVFSEGKWTWGETGQAFSHTEMDEAAFVVYRAALSATQTEQGERDE